MNSAQVLARLWHSKGFIAFSGLTCGASALGISLLIPNSYYATAGVQLQDAIGSNVQSYTISSKQIDEYVMTEAEVARDFRVTGRVVDRLGWTRNFNLAQRYNEQGAGTGLDFRTWLARGVRAGISLTFEEGSPTFQIGYAGSTPEEARAMAGVIRDEYVAYMLEKRRLDAEGNADWVDRQIAGLTEKMEKLEQRNAEFSQEANIVMTPDGVSMAELRLRNAARALEPARLNAAPPPVDDATARQLTQVESELARLSSSLGPNHPQIIELQNRRRELRAAASSASASSAISSAEFDNNRQTELRKQEYIAKADDIATAKRYFDELEALRAEFEELTRRREGYDLDSATMQGGAIPAGEPKIVPGVFFPNRPLAVGVSFGFGTIFAAMLSLFLGLLQMKVATARDLEMLDVERLGDPSDKTPEPKGRKPLDTFHHQAA